MSPPTIPMAIVGFGSIARSHLSALRGLPVVRPMSVRPAVTTIVTGRLDAVRDEATALGVARVVESVAEALEDPELRLVDVASRNDRHATQARAVLEAGRALYLEKPIGRTTDEANGLAALERDATRPAQPGLVLRYEPAMVEARALVRGGAIGEVRIGRTGNFHGSYLDPARPISWRLRSASSGGGAMLDLGVHLIDALRFIFGEVRLVSSAARTVVATRPDAERGEQRVDVDDWSRGELEVETGALISVEASRIFLGAEGVPFELYGTQGSLVGDLSTTGVTLRRFDGREAEYRAAAARDPLVRAVVALRPPERLSLGSFVDLHAAALHHILLRTAGEDPAPGLAPSLSDAAAAEAIAHAIVEEGALRPAALAPAGGDPG